MVTQLSVKEALDFFPFCQISRRHSVLVQHVRIRSGLYKIPHQLGRPKLRGVVKRRLTKFVYHLDYPSFRNIFIMTNLQSSWPVNWISSSATHLCLWTGCTARIPRAPSRWPRAWGSSRSRRWRTQGRRGGRRSGSPTPCGRLLGPPAFKME